MLWITVRVSIMLYLKFWKDVWIKCCKSVRRHWLNLPSRDEVNEAIDEYAMSHADAVLKAQFELVTSGEINQAWETQQAALTRVNKLLDKLEFDGEEREDGDEAGKQGDGVRGEV